jgi:hypothetical protein
MQEGYDIIRIFHIFEVLKIGNYVTVPKEAMGNFYLFIHLIFVLGYIHCSRVFIMTILNRLKLYIDWIIPTNSPH